jgi:YVTN family beta-propeller protein
MSFLQKIVLVGLVLCFTITGFSQITAIDSIDFGSGSEPSGVGVDTVRNLIYVAVSKDSAVYVIDGTGDTVIDTVEIGGEPSQVCVNPDSNLIYVVVNVPDVSVRVIDGSTKSVIDTIAIGV